MAEKQNCLSDRRAPVLHKKRLTAAASKLARGGSTTDPILVGFLRAQKINQAAGGVIVAPWEANDLPDDWVNGAESLMKLNQLREELRAADREIARRIAVWKNKFYKTQ
jgi:hypothetical protein